MKLHLGCFQKKIHGYINVDIRPEVNPDLVDDVFTLPKIGTSSVDVIYACHVLEHTSREKALLALARWYALLKPQGILRLAVPDMQEVAKYYLKTGNLLEVQAFFWGSQRHAYDHHYTGWDFNLLKADLEKIGYRNVQMYDWRTTEHFYIDDYSQCYLPQIAYKTRRANGTIEGTLLSLNVEAQKV